MTRKIITTNTGYHTFEEYPMKQDALKTFGEMTPEEKGALLLAHYERKVIEVYCTLRLSWVEEPPMFLHGLAYRVKPEPKVETVVSLMNFGSIKKITFTVTDGVVSTTVKVEDY